MPDREKVIKGLECCTFILGKRKCDECPYAKGPDCYSLMPDAKAMLKAQEPRVMKVGDVRNWVNSDRVTREPRVIEIRGGVCAWIIDDEVRELPGEANLSSDLYGKTWRCWTSRPTTDKQAEGGDTVDTDKWFVIESIPIKRYCRIKGVFCQLATDNGYCQCTYCVNQEVK